MSFIHGYLLGGLLLAGVPVLLHLILRQQPKRISFPAFRFLKARQRINTRRLQLQHLLLLALRILVIAALCLALARPRIFAHRLSFGSERPVLATLVVDTSPSMEYTVGGKTRLDDARQRIRELLDEMSAGSQVALIESGNDAQTGLLLPPGEVRSRLEGIRIHPGGGSLNQAVDRALRMLEQQPADEGVPRLVYVFSDRTKAAWDFNGLQPKLPPGVTVLLIDVGIESPRDLGISRVEVVPAIVAPGARYEIRIGVRGTPNGHENELTCVVDGDKEMDRPPDRRPVQLPKDVTSDQITIERVAPTPPAGYKGDLPVQVSVRLATKDSLSANNVRHATFIVRGSRRLLTLVNQKDRQRTQIWEAALEVRKFFAGEVRTFDEADKLTAEQLGEYPVIALFEPTDVPASWWTKLATHARNGGGLAIVPAGEEFLPSLKTFNDAGKNAGLLPGSLVKLASAPEGKQVLWERFSGSHPLLAPFVAWSRSVDPDFARDDLRPFVRRYWQIGPLEKGAIEIARYADEQKSPALAEMLLGKGRVILFTSPLDFRWIDEQKRLQWNNYWESSFGLILIDRVTRYLSGESTSMILNFPTGVVPQLTLLTTPPPPLLVSGATLSGSERNLRPPAGDGVVTVQQAVAPGNYQIFDGKERLVAGFSVDIPAKETDLDRIGTEELEAVLGKESIIQVGQTISLREALSNSRPPPVELLPYLMLLLLVVLTLEGLLGNRFYRRQPEPEGPPVLVPVREVKP